MFVDYHGHIDGKSKFLHVSQRALAKVIMLHFSLFSFSSPQLSFYLQQLKYKPLQTWEMGLILSIASLCFANNRPRCYTQKSYYAKKQTNKKRSIISLFLSVHAKFDETVSMKQNIMVRTRLI